MAPAPLSLSLPAAMSSPVSVSGSFASKVMPLSTSTLPPRTSIDFALYVPVPSNVICWSAAVVIVRASSPSSRSTPVVTLISPSTSIFVFVNVTVPPRSWIDAGDLMYAPFALSVFAAVEVAVNLWRSFAFTSLAAPIFRPPTLLCRGSRGSPKRAPSKLTVLPKRTIEVSSVVPNPLRFPWN